MPGCLLRVAKWLTTTAPALKGGGGGGGEDSVHIFFSRLAKFSCQKIISNQGRGIMQAPNMTDNIF